MSPKPKSKIVQLIIRKLSVDLVPNGSKFTDVVDNLLKGNLSEKYRAAKAWVERAIALVKEAPDNPYGVDDEVIAGAILDKITKDHPTS